MDYVSIPASTFYFVFGIVVGAIGIIVILGILAKKQEKKSKERAKQIWDNLLKMNNEEQDEEK